MASSLDKTVELGHYLRIVWRRRGLLFLCMVTTFCASLIALAFSPRVYESEVTLVVEESQLLSSELEKLMGGVGQQSARRSVDEERLAKLVGKIKSRPFLERVVRMLKMNEDPLAKAMAEERCKVHPEVSVEEMTIRILVENLQSRIRITPAGPSVYKVTVGDYGAENAQILAKWISELFVDVSDQESLDRIRVAHEFGTEQLRIYEDQLRRSEDSLESYKKSAIERRFTQSVVRTENLAIAEALHRRMGEEATVARVRLRPLAQALSDLGVKAEPDPLLRDPQVAELAQGLSAALKNELINRLAGTGTELGDWQPSAAYSALRPQLLQQIEAAGLLYYPGTSPEVQNAVTRFTFSRIDLDAQQAAVEMLGNVIDSFKRQAESTPGGEIELTRLEHEVETNRGLLQSFQAQLVASDVSQAVELTKLGLKIEILDPARLPLVPSRPNRPKILVASLFLGILLGVGITFFSESVDPVLRSLADFEKAIPEPILGTTPLLARLVDRRTWIRRNWIAAALASVVFVTVAVYTVRGSVLHNLAAIGVPTKVVNPEGEPYENP